LFKISLFTSQSGCGKLPTSVVAKIGRLLLLEVDDPADTDGTMPFAKCLPMIPTRSVAGERTRKVQQGQSGILLCWLIFVQAVLKQWKCYLIKGIFMNFGAKKGIPTFYRLLHLV
jgi:hypothetical protein